MKHTSLPMKGLLLALLAMAGSSQTLLAEPPSQAPLMDWTARASEQLENRIEQRMQQEMIATFEEQVEASRYASQQPPVDPRVLGGEDRRLALEGD